MEELDENNQTVSGSDESAEDSGSKRLTPVQWQEIIARYEAGTATVSELATEFGISPSAVSKRFRKDSVIKGSKAAEVVKPAVQSQIAQSAADNAETRQKQIEETKTQSLASIKMVHALTHKLIFDQVKKGGSLEAIGGDLKSLKAAAEIFDKTKAQRYAILNIDNDINLDDLEMLQIVDLGEDEIEDLRNRVDEDTTGELIEMSEELDELEEDDD